jgi:hypothetical protein
MAALSIKQIEKINADGALLQTYCAVAPDNSISMYYESNSNRLTTEDSTMGNVLNAVGTGLKKVGACAADHYGLTAIAAGAGALGLPVPKALLGVGRGMAGASDSTSVAGAIGFKLFGAAEPRIGVSLLGTTRLFGIVGRAAPFVSAALFAYDAGAIAACTYKSYQNGPQ